MRVRSIRARLTFWYSSLLTVTLLLLGGAAYGLLVYSLSHDINSTLESVARALAQQSSGGVSRFFPSDIDEVFRRFFGFSPLDQYFDLFDPLGRRGPGGSNVPSRQLPLSLKALKNASEGIPTFETLKGNGSYPVRVLTMPVIESGRVIRLIQVGMSLESSYKARRRFLLILAAMVPIGLALAGGGGSLLARRALKPVERMTETARRISAEHLTERLEETRTGDELDNLAKTLNEMLARLDAAFAQIRQFSADASHELQTPLTILKGELEVALRSPRSPQEYQLTLKSALEEIDRIAQLVEGLLLLARADAGVLRMDQQPLDLSQLVEEVCEQARVLADTHHVTLALGLVESVSIRGDHERLRRLLLNLVDNGIKYTPRGGVVTLSAHKDKGWAILRVSDTGIGLSRGEQEAIFQRFYRAAETRPLGEGGAGLGLCIARSIAQAHGGRIQVESAPGQGTKFIVLLPLDS
jgi:two-component system OmpR family sensor kinase